VLQDRRVRRGSKDHPDQEEPQDYQDLKVTKAVLELQVLQERLVLQVHKVPQVHKDRPELPVHGVQQESMV
jgi:hypothetical protein